MKPRHKHVEAVSRIKEKEILDDRINNPVFCFKYLHGSYNVDGCSDKDKIQFLKQITRLGGMAWKDIDLAPRHGLGYEKIAKHEIRQDLPKEITEDVAHFLAFRFSGKKPFVGFRERFIFHVLYIDRDFTLYSH